MSHIHQLIEQLRTRNDIGVVDQPQSWLICITKGGDWLCEVTVPRDILEWHASVKHKRDKKEAWSDWMDYSGYDDRPKETLEIEMAADIVSFINRVSTQEPLLPLQIYEERA